MEYDECKWFDRPHANIVLNSFYKMQKENYMCDLKLVAGNECIYVHKLVLHSISSYFREMDTGFFKESIENEIVFHKLDFGTLKEIVEFIYTGKIKINESNVITIMETSHLFRISLLKPAVSHFLIKTLNTNNCLQALAYSKRFGYEELAEYILNYIWDNFHFVVCKPSFLDTPPDIFGIVVCSNIFTTIDIYNIFGKWMRYNSGISFDACTKRNRTVEDYMNKLEILEKQPRLTHLIVKYKNFFSKRFFKLNVLISNLYIKDEDQYFGEMQVILAMGGCSESTTLSSVECNYNSNWNMQLPFILKSPKNPSVIPTMKGPCRSSAIAHKRYEVFVMGGINSGIVLNSCKSYDIQTNSWKDFSNLPRAVYGAQAAVVDDVLYITGGVGIDGDITCDVWKYIHDEANDKGSWRKSVSMQQPRAFHGACSVRGVLYVIGGKATKTESEDSYEILQSVERYDDNLEKWIYVTDLPEPKCEFGCVSHNEFIYVFGGSRYKQQILNSCHKYNTLNDTWEVCDNMLMHKCGIAAAVKEDKIYCIGGCDSIRSALATVEMFNPETGRWHTGYSKLKEGRAFAFATTVYAAVPPVHIRY